MKIPVKKLFKKYILWAAALLLLVITIIFFMIILSVTTYKYYFDEISYPEFLYTIDKKLMVSISNSVKAEAKLDSLIDVELSKVLHVKLPIKEVATVDIDDNFIIPLDIEVPVSIDQDFYIKTQVPINTKIFLKDINVHGTFMKFFKIVTQVNGEIPINMTIPWSGSVRVKTNMNARFKQNVNFHLKKRLSFPISLEPSAQIPIKGKFSADFKGKIKSEGKVLKSFPVHFDLKIDLNKIINKQSNLPTPIP